MAASLASSSIGFPSPNNNSSGFLSRRKSRNPGAASSKTSSPTITSNNSFIIIVAKGLKMSAAGLGAANHLHLRTSLFPKRGVVACLPSAIDPTPGVPLPDPNPLKGWLIGVLLSAVLPFFRHKLGSFMQIKNTINEVEEMVHGVEKMAEVVDKVAEEIGGKLPAGKLKDAVVLLERAAEIADKEAEALGELIDKMEEVEETVENKVESLVELSRRRAPAGGI